MGKAARYVPGTCSGNGSYCCEIARTPLETSDVTLASSRLSLIVQRFAAWFEPVLLRGFSTRDIVRPLLFSCQTITLALTSLKSQIMADWEVQDRWERFRQAIDNHTAALNQQVRLVVDDDNLDSDNDSDDGSRALGNGRTIHASSAPFPGSFAVAVPWAPLPRFVAREHIQLITEALQRQCIQEVNRGAGGSDVDFVSDFGSGDDDDYDAEGTFIGQSGSRVSNSATAAGLPRAFGPPPPPAAPGAAGS